MDGRKARDAEVIEELGWYDPNVQQPERQMSLKRDRIEYWLGAGAQPTETVRKLLIRQGIAPST